MSLQRSERGALLRITGITGSAMASTTLAHSSTGTSIMRPFQGDGRGARGDRAGKDFAHPLVERHQSAVG